MEVKEVEAKSTVDSSAKPYFIISHSKHTYNYSVTGHDMYLLSDLDFIITRGFFNRGYTEIYMQ